MRVASFEILVVRVPLRVTVRHSLATRNVAENVVVVARDESGLLGYGETCPRPYVTGETVDGVRARLAEEILPSWLGRTVDLDETGEALRRDFENRPIDQQAAFCAAELALLDLAGRVEGRAAGSLIGDVIRDHVRYSGVIATENVKLVEQKISLLQSIDARHVKVKVGCDVDTNRTIVGLVREVMGTGVSIRLDVNCAWDRDSAVRHLEALAEFELDGVEQPVPAEDIDGMAAVTEAAIAPVVADESICSFEDAERLIERRACNVMNVRIAKCGGLLNAARIHRVARAAGMKSQLGAQVGELGFLSAAGRQFATRLEGVRWREGSFGDLLLEQDVVEPAVKMGMGGLAPALPGVGIGVEAHAERLREYTVSTLVVE